MVSVRRLTSRGRPAESIKRRRFDGLAKRGPSPSPKPPTIPTRQPRDHEPRDHEDTHVLKLLYKGTIEVVTTAIEQTRRRKVCNKHGDTHVLRMLYKGNIEALTRAIEQMRRNSRCTTMNVFEDSDDDGTDVGQKSTAYVSVDHARWDVRCPRKLHGSVAAECSRTWAAKALNPHGLGEGVGQSIKSASAAIPCAGMNVQFAYRGTKDMTWDFKKRPSRNARGDEAGTGV